MKCSSRVSSSDDDTRSIIGSLPTLNSKDFALQVVLMEIFDIDASSSEVLEDGTIAIWCWIETSEISVPGASGQKIWFYVEANDHLLILEAMRNRLTCHGIEANRHKRMAIFRYETCDDPTPAPFDGLATLIITPRRKGTVTSTST